MEGTVSHLDCHKPCCPTVEQYWMCDVIGCKWLLDELNLHYRDYNHEALIAELIKRFEKMEENKKSCHSYVS